MSEVRYKRIVDYVDDRNEIGAAWYRGPGWYYRDGSQIFGPVADERTARDTLVARPLPTEVKAEDVYYDGVKGAMPTAGDVEPAEAEPLDVKAEETKR